MLQSRKWAAFSVASLEEMSYGDGWPWSNLVLLDGHKEAVLALVPNHARGPESERQFHDDTNVEMHMDLVCGKGKGLIVLPHGMPGVGKTSTAECVDDDDNGSAQNPDESDAM